VKVTIFGSGYVGLVTGACLADVGNQVVCVDIDQGKIDRLNAGEIPIFEPGLDAVVARNREAGRLKFTTDIAQGVAHGLFQFIAVGTPPDEDGSADLQHVLAVARSIGEHMEDYRIVVDKSTVPVGTADKVKAEIDRTLAARDAAIDFDVVSNPEFLKEGAAIDDFLKPGPHHRSAASPSRAPPRCMRRALRALQPPARPAHRHGHPLGGAHQVRGQRDAGDQDQLHERARQPRRALRRRHRARASRHRLGPAHRLPLHLPGRRLRRLVFPQGRAGAGAFGHARPASRRCCSRRSRR
jgi:hypothetical protein